jgi:hypothetical protein
VAALSTVFSFLGVDDDDPAPITAELGRNLARIIADGDPASDTYSVSDVFIGVAYALRRLELEVARIDRR